MKNLIIGTAGHIDHGKTALVRALTGINTDRLEEEKRRGITIDIGFAHMEIEDHRIGFIDVPGHERFVKNMLAGIGGIDLLLLAVAADESVMPQTVEHLEICKLLGIRSGLIVVTKKSLVEEELFELVCEEVRDLVAGSFLENAPILGLDSLTGEGLPELKDAIGLAAKGIDRNDSETQVGRKIFRLPIDRVFTIRGFGTVVTGTAIAGRLDRDQTVGIYPSCSSAKVRGIEIFNKGSDHAEAGQRTALNLTSLNRTKLERGMELTNTRHLKPSYMFDVRVSVLDTAPTPLKHRAPIRLHHGSAELMARIHLLGRPEFRPGESGYAQVRLEAATLGFPGDRFVIRRYSPLTTVGGGVLLDNQPFKHRTRDLEAVITRLQALESAIQDATEEGLKGILSFIIENSGRIGVNLAELVSRTGFREETLRETLERMNGVFRIDQEPLLTVSRQAVGEVCTELSTFLKQHQEENPLSPGVPKEELKRRFFPTSSATYFQTVLDLMDEKLEISGGSVRPKGSELRLDQEQEAIKKKLLQILDRRPFQAPNLDELVRMIGGNAEEIRAVYYFLLNQEEILRVADDFVILPDQLERLKVRLRKEFPQGVAFSVPDFKKILDLSRKYAIPLLEFLDRRRITRRKGDQRILIE